MDISLIIPAYNEAQFLPRLLDSIKVAMHNTEFAQGDIEVIVANNASSDGTAEIAREAGCVVTYVEKPMIAAARNGGAAVAKGGILAFVDADSLIHPDTFVRISQAMADPGCIGGATGVGFDRSSPGINATMWIVRPLLYLLGIGSGVVFCRAEDFKRLGGYPEQELVAEDVKFLLALKTLGRQSGRHFRILQGVITLTSTRKFDKYGDWHFFGLMLKLAFAKLFNKKGFQQNILSYWYKR